MIRSILEVLLSIGMAALFVALAGLALDNTIILNVGLKLTGIAMLIYAGASVANAIETLWTARKVVKRG
jgi:hypothetical protein